MLWQRLRGESVTESNNNPLASVDIQRPIVTVDVVLVTLAGEELRLVLQERDREPEKGRPALIGGYVWPQADADVTAAALRILKAKAGLEGLFLEQLMSFSGPDRDPRGWSVSVAYLALVPQEVLECAARSGAAPFHLVDPQSPPALPFDHDRIVAAAMERLRAKSAWSTLPAFLLPSSFSLPELKAIYEKVLGTSLNDSAFRRKILEMRLVEEIEARSVPTADRKRPAQLYRLARPTLTAFDRTV